MVNVRVPPRRVRVVSAWLVVTLLGSVGSGCGHRESAPRHPELTIQLRWVKGYPGETQSNVETGMNWALSFLGLDLARGAPEVYSWANGVVTVDLDAAGLAPATQPAWISVLAALKSSEEYRTRGAMDIGRFLVLTRCSSN